MSVAALAGLAEAANGSAMLAARQAAAAQLEQFRAEMVAEAAKMRAAVERQVLAPRSSTLTGLPYKKRTIRFCPIAIQG